MNVCYISTQKLLMDLTVYNGDRLQPVLTHRLLFIPEKSKAPAGFVKDQNVFRGNHAFSSITSSVCVNPGYNLLPFAPNSVQ